MNTTKIIRSPRNKENPFTRISNSIALLKADEAGIMLQILSNSDNWILNKDQIRKRSQLGRVRFNGCWKHLKELGYIDIRKLPMKNGKFCNKYTIYEIPEVQNLSTVDDKPYTDFRTTVSRTTETGGTNNYYITSTNSNTDGSIPRNEVEERPDQNLLDPIILDPVNNNKDNLQIVPHSPLHCESVRDNESNQNEEPKKSISTKEKVMPDNIVTSTKDCNTIAADTRSSNDEFEKYFSLEWEKISKEMIDGFDIHQMEKFGLLSD